MAQRILLFSAGDTQEDMNAQKALNRLGNVKLKIVWHTKVLEGRVLLPFIETADGSRYYGLRSIEKFVDRELRRTQTVAR